MFLWLFQPIRALKFWRRVNYSGIFFFRIGPSCAFIWLRTLQWLFLYCCLSRCLLAISTCWALYQILSKNRYNVAWTPNMLHVNTRFVILTDLWAITLFWKQNRRDRTVHSICTPMYFSVHNAPFRPKMLNGTGGVIIQGLIRIISTKNP